MNEEIRKALESEILARLKAMPDGPIDEGAFAKLYELKLEEDKLERAKAEAEAAAKDKVVDRKIGVGIKVAECAFLAIMAGVVLLFEETGSIRSLPGKALMNSIFKFRR